MFKENIKIIANKIVGDIEYRLRYWPNDNLFVVYEFNKNIKSIHRLRAVFQSQSEKEAKRYLDNL